MWLRTRPSAMVAEARTRASAYCQNRCATDTNPVTATPATGLVETDKTKGCLDAKVEQYLGRSLAKTGVSPGSRGVAA